MSDCVCMCDRCGFSGFGLHWITKMAFPWENGELNNFVEVIFLCGAKWFFVIETNISSIYISDGSDDAKQSKKKSRKKMTKNKLSWWKTYLKKKHTWKIQKLIASHPLYFESWDFLLAVSIYIKRYVTALLVRRFMQETKKIDDFRLMCELAL